VLAVAHPRLREELFRYDAADRLYETGAGAPARAYAAGGRLEQRGDLRHTWDAAGRLIRREALGPTGAVAETWRFAWDAADRLQSIVKPDGTTLDFVYDALGRRVSKTVRAPAPASGGAGPVRASTRFVWDRDTIAHEIRTAAADSGDPVIEERTYAWVEETYVPFAHRDVRIVGGVREDLGTVHYANDPIGTPAHLLGPDGAVVGRVVRTAWGARSEEGGRATPLRFQGQYEDEETGLYYNRHRYYDPETGTYLSADPIGLAGGQLPFGYVTNPFVVVDPTGLGGGNTTITLNDGTEIDGTSNSGNPPHPAIAAAIPDLPDGTKPPTPKGTKGQCAEVDALSKLLDREKVPRDGTATKEQVDNAMKKIKTVETTDKETGAPKKACGFCGRMMSNLGIPKSKIVNG
jgi:RHS repeat-associated protein